MYCAAYYYRPSYRCHSRKPGMIQMSTCFPVVRTPGSHCSSNVPSQTWILVTSANNSVDLAGPLNKVWTCTMFRGAFDPNPSEEQVGAKIGVFTNDQNKSSKKNLPAIQYIGEYTIIYIKCRSCRIETPTKNMLCVVIITSERIYKKQKDSLS